MVWLKTNATAARDKLSAEVSKFKNREFMEAVVSGCALVAVFSYLVIVGPIKRVVLKEPPTSDPKIADILPVHS